MNMRILTGLLLVPSIAAQAGAVLTTLHSFTGTNDGANPQAALVQGSDGNLYGTTFTGGTNGLGTVFKISASGAFTNLCSFTGTNDGANPDAVLVRGNDGNFYGTTSAGGTNDFGTVFKITTNGALTSLYSFSGTNAGANPQFGHLVQGADGSVYGLTYSSIDTNGGFGPTIYGAVFKISTDGEMTNLYSFAGSNQGPFANINALVQGSDGNFYGTTHFNVFQITSAGTLTTLAGLGSENGPWPGTAGGLIQGSDGNFYSTTFQGGGSYPGFGTVFNIRTNGTLTPLHSFTGSDGGGPVGGLMQSSDGYLYGTTTYGGTNGYGTVFKITTNGALTTLYSFNGTNDGASPYAGLVQGSDGSFYGTTYDGGANGMGTVFRMTIVPEFQAMNLTNNTLNLTWSTETGGTYQLQYTSDLNSSNWISLNSPITATGATLLTTDIVTNAPQRFYRLAISP